jgi:excisionase family DNA binding protein
MTQQLDRDFLTVAEAAEYLRCSSWTVRELIKRGILEASRLVPRGKVRISAVSIEKALQKRH